MIWWFFLFILGFVFLHRKWRYRYLMAIPGPPSLPLIGNTLPMLASPERAWCLLQEYNKVYYPIYRLSNGLLDSVHISAPDDIELILSSKTHLRKSIIYDLLQSWLGKGLLTSDGDRWYHRRKLLTPTFHFNIIQQFFTVFATHSEALVQQLDKECDKSCTNIIPLITKFTLFTICETAMGTKLDEKKEGNRDYVSATFEMGQLFINRIRRPWLAYNVIFNMTEKKKEQTSLLNILHSFSKSVIEDRKQHFKEVVQNEDEHDDQFHQKKRVAMLDLLLSVRNSGAQISDEEIREEVDTFIFEGHDTTSAAISYALMLIANHSNVQVSVILYIRSLNKNFLFND
uniref:Cytochrome P450 n=1 Tax=Photinus pyralis TaxID=7054 RepID=A0A1Y1M2Y2_PHOPY